MAKRFTDTKVWSEDWFLEMPNEYKMFWFYMLSTCDHAGIFKVNLRSFRGLLEVSLTSKTALEHFNNGKERIRVLNDSTWFIEDFFVYQYGTTFNYKNRLHESIGKIYFGHGIDLTSIRGLLDLKLGVKDKDKEIYILELLESNSLLNGQPTNEKNIICMVVLEMMGVWKVHSPEYREMKEVDYPALFKIAVMIAELKKWSYASITNYREHEVVNSWQKIVSFLAQEKTDAFLKRLTVDGLSIPKNFQKLVEAMRITEIPPQKKMVL